MHQISSAFQHIFYLEEGNLTNLLVSHYRILMVSWIGSLCIPFENRIPPKKNKKLKNFIPLSQSYRGAPKLFLVGTAYRTFAKSSKVNRHFTTQIIASKCNGVIISFAIVRHGTNAVNEGNNKANSKELSYYVRSTTN